MVVHVVLRFDSVSDLHNASPTHTNWERITSRFDAPARLVRRQRWWRWGLGGRDGFAVEGAVEVQTANLINDGGDGVQIALRSSLAIGPQSAMHAELVRQNQGDPKKFIDPEKLMDLITLVKRHNGASGKSKPAPRLPTPIPRTYQIVKTSHSIQRTLDRGIKLVDLDDTIVNGREIPTHEKGRRGGDISKFTKRLVIRTSGLPVSRDQLPFANYWPINAM